MQEFLKNCTVFLVSATLCYLPAEAGYSYAYRRGLIDPTLRDGWFFKDADQTIHFDPVIGYRLSSHPSPNIRIVMGKVEYEGVFQGNNQGFQDSHDFYPGRPANNPYRVAILGDSFATEQFHERNWPDSVEAWDAQSPSKRSLQILNFSLNGGGLVNWRNILLHRIEKEGYQLDLLVIPVFADNLFRSFVVYEARNTRKLLIGRTGFNPDTLPSRWEEIAACCVYKSDGYLLNAEEWHRFTKDGWHPDLPLPAKAYLAEQTLLAGRIAAQKIRDWLKGNATTGQWESDDARDSMPDQYSANPSLGAGQLGPDQQRLIQDIRDAARRMKLPILVVRVPDRYELEFQAPVAGNVTDFAAQLEVPVIDGLAAFAHVPANERQKEYFRHDGHWNQQGSDHFARFMLGLLQQKAGTPQAVVAIGDEVN